MATIESFPDVAAADLVGTDYVYIRRGAAAAGGRDARFAFSSLVRGLFAAADKPAARVALGIITNASTLNFGSIASLGAADLTITVTGAAVGDAVHLGLPAAPTAGIAFNAFVSAANTVTVRAMNYTAGAIDPAAAAYRVVVIKSA